MRSTYFLLGPPTPPVAVHDDSGHEDLRGCPSEWWRSLHFYGFLRKIPAKTRQVFEVLPIKSRVIPCQKLPRIIPWVGIEPIFDVKKRNSGTFVTGLWFFAIQSMGFY
jgi:hypothetical protein